MEPTWYNEAMKLHLPIKSFHEIEEFLNTTISKLPQVSPVLRIKIVSILPYLSSALGALLIASALVPFLGDFSVQDPFTQTGLFMFNVILLRIAAIIFGVVLVVSFSHLTRHSLRGWYNLFYLSIFQVFFVILIFNVVSLVSLIFTWYVLFNIKKEYS